MKSKLKKQNGITLVALVITIIVLLILAGISIKIAVSGGLLERAQGAVKTNTEQTQKEAIELGYSAYLMDKAKNESATLEVENSKEITKLNNGWAITFADKIYNLAEDGFITEEEQDDGNGECVIYYDGFEGGSKKYKYDTKVTLDKLESNLSYALTDKNGKIYTFVKDNIFFTPYNKAIYVKKVEETYPKIAIMGSFKKILENENKKLIGFNCQFYLPEDCKVIEHGLIGKYNAKSVQVKASKRGAYNEYAITLTAYRESPIESVTGVAYITYTKDSKTETIYSNEVTRFLPK